MEHTDTLDSIRTLAARHSGADASAIDADIPVDQLGIDSLGFLEFLFELEDHFGVPIPPDAVKHVRTLRELATVIEALPLATHPPATT